MYINVLVMTIMTPASFTLSNCIPNKAQLKSTRIAEQSGCEKVFSTASPYLKTAFIASQLDALSSISTQTDREPYPKMKRSPVEVTKYRIIFT